MSLEDALNENTAAVKALTAAMKGGSSGSTGAAAKTTTTSNKPPAGKGKPGVTPEAACALIQRINDEHGKTEARAVLNDCGLAKMAEIDASNAAEVAKAAKAKIAELEAGGEEEEEEGSL